MITPSNKLFVQLQPDDDGWGEFQNLQSQLNSQPNLRIVGRDSLHMTILHIGVVHRLMDAIARSTTIDGDQLLHLITTFSDRLCAIVKQYNDSTFTLRSSGEAYFGPTNSTYVVTFDASSQLVDIHKVSLQALHQLLTECGITDTRRFMQTDHNLQHALTIRPHVTIAKSYLGPRLNIPDMTVKFRLTPVIY